MCVGRGAAREEYRGLLPAPSAGWYVSFRLTLILPCCIFNGSVQFSPHFQNVNPTFSITFCILSLALPGPQPLALHYLTISTTSLHSVSAVRWPVGFSSACRRGVGWSPAAPQPSASMLACSPPRCCTHCTSQQYDPRWACRKWQCMRACMCPTLQHASNAC